MLATILQRHPIFCEYRPCLRAHSTALHSKDVISPTSALHFLLVGFSYHILLGVRSRLQSLVATRAGYQIVHHHAIPTHGQESVPPRKSRPTSSPTSTASGERRGVKDSSMKFSGDNVPARISSATTNKEEPASSGPPLVVIDGSNVAFAYREGDGRWFPQGPLLTLKVSARFHFSSKPSLFWLSCVLRLIQFFVLLRETLLCALPQAMCKESGCICCRALQMKEGEISNAPGMIRAQVA